MRNKKIIMAIGILAAVFILFFIFKNISFAPVAEITGNESNVATSTLEQTNTSIKPAIKQLSAKDEAWGVFQKYLEYNKAQNLDGIKDIVYKVNQICESKVASDDCKKRMSLAYSYGIELQKTDFINVWNDEKQIILSTDFWTESSKDLDQYGRFRSIMFFIKEEDGKWKLLSFSPTAGGAINKGAASQEEVDARLIRYTEDNDQDGITDYDEECLATKEGQTCIKTSPKIRDTDGNGYWDGVQALMK